APSQSTKTAAPTVSPRQPKRQSSWESGCHQRAMAATATMSRSAYQVSKPLELAREIMPAARIPRKGSRYAAVGLVVGAAPLVRTLRLSHGLLRLASATPQAAQLKAIQPAWEWKP